MEAGRTRTVLVTGATSGIGLETARQLASLGMHVLVHGRSAEKAHAATADVATHGAATAVWADFARLDDVRSLADQVLDATDTLDVLVNNAGVYMREFALTPDSHETTFQVNHLSPFLLTNLVLPAICDSPAGRVVTLSSVAHFRGAVDFDDLDHRAGYDAYGAYAASKLENVLFAFELARRLQCEAVTSNVAHPGVVATKLLAAGFPTATGVSTAHGAATPVFLSASPEVEGVTGAYFVDRRRAHASPAAQDADVARRLWEVSCALLGLDPS